VHLPPKPGSAPPPLLRSTLQLMSSPSTGMQVPSGFAMFSRRVRVLVLGWERGVEEIRVQRRLRSVRRRVVDFILGVG
jgi:hypothetical protein